MPTDAPPADHLADASGIDAVPAHPRLSVWHRLAGTDPNPALPDWHRPSPGWRGLRTEVVVALVLVGLLVLTERLNAEFTSGSAVLTPPWAAVLVPVVGFITLSFRRLAPLPAMVLGVAMFLVGQAALYGEYLFTQVICFVLIFSASAWSRYRTVVTVLNLSTMLLFLMFGVLASITMASDPTTTGQGIVLSFVFSIVINILFVLAAAVFGSNEYRRARDAHLLERRTAELNARTASLEAERRVVAEQAVRLDRVEIARELHDVVAHHVSLMGLQAAAARRSLARSPEQAEAALLSVESSARGAISELQMLLTTLRADDADGGGAGTSSGGDAGAGGAGGAPSTISIAQVPELIAGLRAAGLHISHRVIGEPRDVTPLVGFTAYRILQEALTNARKHGGDDVDIDVRLRYLADELEIDVTNGQPTGRRWEAGASRGGGGRGLVGMRERAAAVGGHIEVGPRDAGGFRVVARLPYGEPARGAAPGTAPGAAPMVASGADALPR